MRKLAQGLSWLAIWKMEWHVPTSSALAQTRERLGSEPLRELFERASRAVRAAVHRWRLSLGSAGGSPRSRRGDADALVEHCESGLEFGVGRDPSDLGRSGRTGVATVRSK